MSPYTLPDPLLESLLQDDVPCGDATTQALAIGGQPGRMVLRARGEMVLRSAEALTTGEPDTAVAITRILADPRFDITTSLCKLRDLFSRH